MTKNDAIMTETSYTPPAPVAYINARLIDPANDMDCRGGILVKGGKVIACGANVTADNVGGEYSIYDCNGMVLCPGLLDIRVNLKDPGDAKRRDGTWQAAAAGGVTGFACLPDESLPLDDKTFIDLISHINRLGQIKLYCYGAITRGLNGTDMAEIGLMRKKGAIAFTDGNKAIKSSETMMRIMLYAKNFDALIVQHPEDPSLSHHGLMNMGEISSRLGLKGIPKQAEVILIERDLRLLELCDGGKYHVAHITTKAGVEAVRMAKRKGLNVTCDTAPHYFILNEMSVQNYRTFAKVSPPLRDEEDRLAIIEGLKDGTIDIIASDHIPKSEDDKRLTFEAASPGVVGLETLLPASLKLYHDGHLSLKDLIACLTCNPARRLSLNAGTLTAGGPADITIFDVDKPWQLDAKNLHGKHKNTAFDGMLFNGAIQKTICDGRVIYTDPC